MLLSTDGECDGESPSAVFLVSSIVGDVKIHRLLSALLGDEPHVCLSNDHHLRQEIQQSLIQSGCFCQHFEHCGVARHPVVKHSRLSLYCEGFEAVELSGNENRHTQGVANRYRIGGTNGVLLLTVNAVHLCGVEFRRRLHISVET